MITIYPVIMAGGAGTRLWPLSTADDPKQFQSLFGDRTLFQETVLRVQGTEAGVRFAAPSVIGSTRFASTVRAQLAEIGITPHRVMLEPFGRNTAPVAAMASAIPDTPSDLVLLLPSDHYMADPAAFRAAIADAATRTADGWITTFGIEANRPETGYGYIRRGTPLEGDLARCDAFVEKPNMETALQYLADGRYAWNGGIFLFPASTMRDQLRVHAPDILDATLSALAAGTETPDGVVLDPAVFETCAEDSIDYALMEKTDKGAVYGPLRCGWSDIGSWDALADLAPSETQGDVLSINTEGCYIRSDDDTLVTAIGVKDLVIVASKGAVMVVPRHATQAVKSAVNALKAAKRFDRI